MVLQAFKLQRVADAGKQFLPYGTYHLNSMVGDKGFQFLDRLAMAVRASCVKNT